MGKVVGRIKKNHLKELWVIVKKLEILSQPLKRCMAQISQQHWYQR